MRIRSALAATLTCCALLAGCGTGSGGTASSPGGSTPSPTTPSAAVSTAAPMASTTAGSTAAPVSSAPSASASSSPVSASAIASSAPAAVPKRIVSMSPTATEDLFAIGAGSLVVAVDDESDYPASAPKTDLSAYKPNVEAIAKYQPDLVVLSDDVDNIKEQLTKLSIPVLLEPAAASLNDAYQEIHALGTATGHAAAAGKTVARMKSGIAALVATVPHRAKPLSYFHELDNTLYTVSSHTFIGQIYALAGLQNVADAGNPKATAYPQLSAEFLVKSNPDLIFLADTKCCQQTAATFASRPGFSVLSAVKDKHVIPLDDDIASRWGPRVVQLLKNIVDAVKSVRSS